MVENKDYCTIPGGILEARVGEGVNAYRPLEMVVGFFPMLELSQVRGKGQLWVY